MARRHARFSLREGGGAAQAGQIMGRHSQGGRDEGLIVPMPWGFRDSLPWPVGPAAIGP
jgi:hypothetical protein